MTEIDKCKNHSMFGEFLLYYGHKNVKFLKTKKSGRQKYLFEV